MAETDTFDHIPDTRKMVTEPEVEMVHQATETPSSQDNQARVGEMVPIAPLQPDGQDIEETGLSAADWDLIDNGPHTG